jgi:ribose/xylose/arabinose/galactoside ABC-type transport system permease subunit
MSTQSYRAIVMVVVLLAICATFSALTIRESDDGERRAITFLSVMNLKNVLLQCAITTVAAVGMTLVIIAGGIDLSVGSLVALCTVVFAIASRRVEGSAGIAVGVGACLAAGAGFGVLNGALVVHIGAPPFIVTLGTMLIGRGLAFVFAGGRTIHVGSVSSDPFVIPVMISLGTVVLAHAFLAVTRYGRYVYATGGSEEASRLSGVPVGRVKMLTYVACGICAALGAIVYLIRMQAGNPLAQEGLELYAIAAAIVGGTSLSGGRGDILGTLIGALIMGVLANGLGLLSVPDYWQKVIIGAVIVIAVGAEILRQRWQDRAVSLNTSPKG